MTPPLDGIRVLDLTRVLAGPFATQRLGDMGADVIKVELPDGGDPTRAWGPPFKNGVSAYFFSVNRNKRSVTVDLKSDGGREIIRKLAATCDVLVENFRPGTLDRLKLGPFDPKLIVCSISGYGQTGGWRDRPSYDVVIQGESGVQDLTGFPDGPPTKMGISVTDLVAGMTAVESILLALIHRGKSGAGQAIDISLMDSITALTTFQAQNYFFSGEPPRRRGNAHPSIVPYETFATRDGHVVLGVGNESQWERFRALLGLADRPEWRTNADRVRSYASLTAALEPILKSRTTDAWVEALGGQGIPCGRIRNLAETLESPELKERGMVVGVKHPEAGEVRMTGIPQNLSASPGAIRLPPPRLGEHTDDVLTEIGYTNNEIDQLRANGAL